MNILSIDTSTQVMGVAVTTEEQTRALALSNSKKNHASRCVPMIQQVIQDGNLQINDINGIAVAQGPGSYTGLRIGIVTAKTLAWTLQLPLLGFSSLEIMAARAGAFSGWISPCIDARRGQIYTGLYQWQDGQLVSIIPDRLIPVQRWITLLEVQVEGPILFVGDDVRIHRQTMIEAASSLTFQFGFAEQHVPDVAYMGRMAALRIAKDGLVYQAAEVERFQPSYLRMAEAEAKLLAKQQGANA